MAHLEIFGTDIWIADGPAVTGIAGFHFPTRMAVIRLADGGLFIWSPVTLDPALKAEVEALGPGEIVSVIGPNGAGKTTLFNMISGLYLPARGRVTLGGEDVTGMEPHLLAARGLSRTFQNLQIFHAMTVLENVEAGHHLHERGSVVADLLSLPSSRRRNAATRESAHALLGRVGLGPGLAAPGGGGAGGRCRGQGYGRGGRTRLRRRAGRRSGDRFPPDGPRGRTTPRVRRGSGT